MSTRFITRIAAFLAASLWAGSSIQAGDASPPLAPNPAWIAEGDQYYARFGESVSSAGDVNGDGYSDVVVGATTFGVGATWFGPDPGNEGRANVYFGSAKGLPSVPDWTVDGDQLEGQFGGSVSSAGDVNGDGFDDVLVGAINYEHGKKGEGRAYLFLGSAEGLAQTPAWHAEGHQKYARFGSRVAGAGDVNGDGFVDVLVGAPGFAGDEAGGRVFLFLGSKADLGHPPTWITVGDDSAVGLGSSVSTAGDVNADGFSDIVLGARYGGTAPVFPEGIAFVYLGSALGLGPTPAWTAEGNQDFAYFGQSVATAGDIDSDGYSDVVIGSPGFGTGELSGEGRALLFRGSASGVELDPSWTAEGDQFIAHFGGSVGSAGDVNGDGYSDVVVGAPGIDDDQPSEGRVFVYLGSESGLALDPAWTADGNDASSAFAVVVGTAGDVNGDGFSDIIVGDNAFDHGDKNEGRAHVYLGAPPASKFVPGDRLHGMFTAPSDLTAAAFDGIAGMKLRLDFGVIPSPMKIRLQLLAADGAIAKQSTVQLGEDSVTKVLKLQKSGPYTLRWNLLSGTPGAFEVTTSRTLPEPPKPQILKPKTGKTTASLALHALPGAILDVTLTKKVFTGTIGVSMTRPDKTTFDVSAYATTAEDGSVTLTDVPCEIVGAYKLEVSGFTNSDESVKAKITITQPAPGDSDVDLP